MGRQQQTWLMDNLNHRWCHDNSPKHNFVKRIFAHEKKYRHLTHLVPSGGSMLCIFVRQNCASAKCCSTRSTYIQLPPSSNQEQSKESYEFYPELGAFLSPSSSRTRRTLWPGTSCCWCSCAPVDKKELFLARDRMGIKPLYYIYRQNHISWE